MTGNIVKIGFSTQKSNILSRFIRLVTQSKASHCFLIVNDPLFGECVIEASEFGVQLLPMKTFTKRGNDLVATFPVSVDVQKAMQAVEDWLGTAYDFRGLLGMIWVYIGRVFRKRCKNPVRSSYAMFCSEFVVRVLMEAEFPGIEQLDPNDASPEDVRLFLLDASV